MSGKLLLKKQTKFQLLHLVEFKENFNIYIDGVLQFSSQDEHRYHEPLVHPAMALSPSIDNILVIGGGDGLALREILKYDDVENIKLVDIDPEMVELCSTEPMIVELNKNSISNPRVTYLAEDAWEFIQKREEFFDVIIVDLPDPEDRVLSKLYSNTFYHMLGRLLMPGGAITVQSGSPFIHNSTFNCIYNTVKSTGLYVKPMNTLLPTFGNWGFMLVSNKEFEIDDININVKTKYLNKAIDVKELFKFREDFPWKETVINTVDNYAIINYYEKTSIPALRWVLPYID